jgi:hypothetical protein
MHEVPPLLAALTDSELHTSSYRGTFVLDHQGFPRRLLDESRCAVLKLCGFRASPQVA